MCDFFFFFKQKTAYDMRISDWSSDVCSSDLSGEPAPVLLLPGPGPDGRRAPPAEDGDAKTGAPAEAGATAEEGANSEIRREPGLADHENVASEPVPEVNEFDFDRGGKGRSEEHTSELQSLMRISYAVFCLKKKKQQTTQTDYHNDYDHATKHN